MLDRALDPVRARADLRTRRDIGETTSEQVEAIKAAIRRDFGQEFDVTGFRHTVYEPELRKVWRKHGGGNETHPDGVPLTREDFELIPEIVATGRVVSARPSRARQQPGVLYVKRIGDTYGAYMDSLTGGRFARCGSSTGAPPVMARAAPAPIRHARPRIKSGGGHDEGGVGGVYGEPLTRQVIYISPIRIT